MFPPRSFIPRSPRPRLSARDAVLAQWRGWDSSADEKAWKVTSKPVSDVMQQVLGKIRIDRRQSEAEIVKVWNNLIDPTITAHAQPTGVVRGTLFVTVDSSVWLDEIVRYRRKEILTRLQSSFGHDVIGKISFRVG